MTNKHTPGPWNWNLNTHDLEYHYATINNANGGVAVVTGFVNYAEKATANAKLIAAAPQLLEACKEAFRMYEKIDPPGGWQGVYGLLISAIQKATL